ncbi:MAG: glycine--tRNA ligase subunit beta, partial [Coriobacteriia bacterium]|nr:glycine--tRNA ligase subunit beta [Coriobacteriia bacterium]
GIEALEMSDGVRVVVPEKTFAEVVNLVEWPTVVKGRFDAEFLEVPREVLETAMTKHQRYFPVQTPDGELDNAFVVVHNGDPSRSEQIVAGHERVIRARLADAAFFYREDLAVNMEDWVARLDAITFHEKLGTSGAKVARVEALVNRLAALHDADAAETAVALRTAHLAKADLVSQVVVEFPTLQGLMGSYYAVNADERVEVATAIREHYQPRFAGDALPSSVAGMLVSVADRLDTMVGIFAIGQAPTGSADPYALRRGAIGILAMLLDGGLKLTVTETLRAALAGYDGVIDDLDPDEIGAKVAAFIAGRLETILRDRGHSYDTVAAVLAAATDDPADALKRCEALSVAREQQGDVFDDLSTAFARARNLAKPELGTETDPSIMGAEERALADALQRAEAEAVAAMSTADYTGTLAVLGSLRKPVDTFFENVLVMDSDETLRDNRLRLLNRFVALFARFADFGRLTG